MAVEQRADNAPAQHSGKRFLISLRLEGRYDFIALRKAANVQTLFVRRAAAKARIVWRVSFLNAFFVHDRFVLPAFAPNGARGPNV